MDASANHRGWRNALEKVEIIFIASGGPILDSETGDGIWEGGRIVWNYIRPVAFSSCVIPVVPLEIQLESQFRRARPDRVNEIMAVLRRSEIDYSLLKKALSEANFHAFSARNSEQSGGAVFLPANSSN